jgi:hypothetical protein
MLTGQAEKFGLKISNEKLKCMTNITLASKKSK